MSPPRATLLLMTTMHATMLAPGEVSQVLQAVANAPRVSLVPGWLLDLRPDIGRIIVIGSDARHACLSTLLGAGIALEHLVVELEARHHRLAVIELPADDPASVGTVRILGPGHPSTLTLQLRDLSEHPEHRQPVTDIRPADLRVLNLTAEAFTAEVMWSDDIEARRDLKGQQRLHPARDASPYATIVTPGDATRDWVHAGRALARLLLCASALGLEAHLELQVLGQTGTRQELRKTWGLTGFPQAQFSLSSHRTA